MYNVIHNDVFVNKKIAKVNIFVESVRFYMVTCVGNLDLKRRAPQTQWKFILNQNKSEQRITLLADVGESSPATPLVLHQWRDSQGLQKFFPFARNAKTFPRFLNRLIVGPSVQPMLR